MHALWTARAGFDAGGALRWLCRGSSGGIAKSNAQTRSRARLGSMVQLRPTALARPLESESNNSWGDNLRGLGHNNYVGKVLNARVYDLARETPLQEAPIMSAACNNRVLIKREDLQPVVQRVRITILFTRTTIKHLPSTSREPGQRPGFFQSTIRNPNRIRLPSKKIN